MWTQFRTIGDIQRLGSLSIHLDNDAFSHIFTEDETPTRSTVIGKPVLLALEDVDGSPSFLEKALRFVEDHGIASGFQLDLLLVLAILTIKNNFILQESIQKES